MKWIALMGVWVCGLLLAGCTPVGLRAPGREKTDARKQTPTTAEQMRTVVEGLLEEGPSAVRRLRRELGTYEPSSDDHARLTRLLGCVRAGLMSVSEHDVRTLDGIGDYEECAPRRDENGLLVRILKLGAVQTDYGRAEVLEAFLRRYKSMADIPVEERGPYKGYTNPREVLRRIVAAPMGPEVAMVVDEHLHLLLFHAWISNIPGVYKLVVTFVQSEFISSQLYQTLLDNYIRTILRKRTTEDSSGAYGSDGEPRQSHEFALRRDAPESWPGVSGGLLVPLWRSAAASDEDRDRLFDALVQAAIQATPKDLNAGRASERFVQLLLEDLLTPKMVCVLVDRAVEAWEPLQPVHKKFIMRALMPILKTASVRGMYPNARGWDRFWSFWSGGGREGPWTVPLDHPLTAIACVLLEEERGEAGVVFLSAHMVIEPGKTSRVRKYTPHGRLDCSIAVRRLPWDDQLLLVKAGCSGTLVDDPEEDLWVRQAEGDYGQHVRNGLIAYLTESFAYNPDGASPKGLVLWLIDDADALSPPQVITAEWAFDQFHKRFPPGQLIPGCGSFPGQEDAFLPEKYRMRLAERYFDELPPADALERPPSVETAIRIAQFAAHRGNRCGIDYLAQWVANRWRGWRHLEKPLAECETLLRLSSGRTATAELAELIQDPNARATTLRKLLAPQYLDSLEADGKCRLAKLVVLDVLPGERDVGRQFQLIHLLRKLTGLTFGYRPLDEAAAQEAAIEEWAEWAKRPTPAHAPGEGRDKP